MKYSLISLRQIGTSRKIFQVQVLSFFEKLSNIFHIFVYVSNNAACISKSSRDIFLEKVSV